MKYNRCFLESETNAGMTQMALLIYAGSDVEDLNDSLPEPVKPKGDVYIHWTTYAKSKAKLLSYFSLKSVMIMTCSK